MHFESRWMPDAFALKSAMLQDIAQGPWTEVGPGGLEPSLAWTARLLRAEPRRGSEIANLLLELGLQHGAPALAVAVLLASASCPELLEIAQYLAYRHGPGEAREALERALPTLEARARAVSKPYACVVWQPEPAVLWLADAQALWAAVEASVELGQPRAGGEDPLDWLGDLLSRLPWVAAELPALLTRLLAGSAAQRRAALAFGLHQPPRAKLKAVWQAALTANPAWLSEPAPPALPGPHGQTLGQVLAALRERH